jgi:DNA polymerase-3 subunit alpha
VKGRVSEDEDNASKLICEMIVPFDEVPCELWIQYPDVQTYQADEQTLFEMLKHSEGRDRVVIYCTKEKAMKRLPANRNIHVEPQLLENLEKYFGKERVKVVEKQIEKV